jgi:hypothetical protein
MPVLEESAINIFCTLFYTESSATKT